MVIHYKGHREWSRTTRLDDSMGTVYPTQSSRTVIGKSPQMLRVFELIKKAAATQFPVLIVGEPGTGKNLVAEKIHALGPRRNEPFVPIHCLEFSSTLIANTLFGHVPGSFPDAVDDQIGLLGYAKEGTLFLDEIPALPSELQRRLLGVIEQRAFRPLGSGQFQPCGARVLAATNQDLGSVLREGSLRKDPYYRLNVISICLPPLRARKEDIPLLAQHILKRLYSTSVQNKTSEVTILGRDAVEILMGHEWPGNVRELEYCLERVVAYGCGPAIQANQISLDTGLSPLVSKPTSTNDVIPKPSSRNDIIPLEEVERYAILRALSTSNGDRKAAARLLGIGKTTLYRKLNRYRKSHR